MPGWSHASLLHQHDYDLYKSFNTLETKYRSLTVKNYILFYTVSGLLVGIHRIIYDRMELKETIGE